MMNSRLSVVVLVVLAACTSFYAPRQSLPIREVVNMSKAGAPPPAVIQRIKESATTYALHGSDFAKLKAMGVRDPVLDYLQQSFVDHLDLLTRYWVLGESLGGCRFCYPQPVDLDRIESGFSAVPATPPGRYGTGKPPGTPDWVPATVRGSSRIRADEIVEMARNGVPEDQIIQKIRNSRLTNVIGVGGLGTIRTQPVAGLSGSQLASLHEQGLGYAVLDALQSQFLAQFIEAERLRYQNWGKGPGPDR